MFIEDLIDFIVILDKFLLAYMFLDQILIFIFLGQSQYLNVIDLMAIESQNELWIYDFVIFIVVSHTIVVLFVF